MKFKDGTSGTASFDIQNGKWSDVVHYKLIDRIAPSIPEKFPDQAQKPYTYGRIEDMDKSEVKSMWFTSFFMIFSIKYN